MLLAINKYPIWVGCDFANKQQTNMFYLAAHQTLKMEKQYCENWATLLVCVNTLPEVVLTRNVTQEVVCINTLPEEVLARKVIEETVCVHTLPE